MDTKTMALLEELSDSELERIADIIYKRLAQKLDIEDCDCEKEIVPTTKRINYTLPAIGGGVTHHIHDEDEDEKEEITDIELPPIESDMVDIVAIPPIPADVNEGFCVNITKSLINIVNDKVAKINESSILAVKSFSFDEITKEITFIVGDKKIRCLSESSDSVKLTVTNNDVSRDVVFTLVESDIDFIGLSKNDIF